MVKNSYHILRQVKRDCYKKVAASTNETPEIPSMQIIAELAPCDNPLANAIVRVVVYPCASVVNAFVH